jgi:cytochrome c-type biogenesis protein CcmH
VPKADEGSIRALVLIAVFLLASTLVAQDALKVPDAQQFVGNPKGTPIAGEALYRRTSEVASLLRCPVCQGLSVADSPSEMAVNMKAQVKELLGRGYAEEQILEYFELSYGQFVLLKPKFEGVNALVWLIPIGALVLGVAIVFFKLKKLEAVAPSTNKQKPTTDNSSEDPYLARVRDLVGGERNE